MGFALKVGLEVHPVFCWRIKQPFSCYAMYSQFSPLNTLAAPLDSLSVVKNPKHSRDTVRYSTPDD
jgi:hypothetical protein